MEEVAVEDPAEGTRDPFGVAETGGDQGVVQMAVRGVVLGAAQFEGAVGGGGQVRGVVGGDLVQRPDGVEVAEVAVVVGVGEVRLGPFGQCPVRVDPVRREPVGEGPPAVGVLGVAVGGGAQRVPGGGEVHGRVDRPQPAFAGRFSGE
ncbi:hypothetical protein SHIRM173S_02554 [Streptomyces hirsutus]